MTADVFGAPHSAEAMALHPESGMPMYATRPERYLEDSPIVPYDMTKEPGALAPVQDTVEPPVPYYQGTPTQDPQYRHPMTWGPDMEKIERTLKRVDPSTGLPRYAVENYPWEESGFRASEYGRPPEYLER